MPDSGLKGAERVAALRGAFDRSFTEAPKQKHAPDEDFLAIRLADSPYALRLSEVSALAADRKIAKIPGSVPTLLGVAGYRGTIVPVYDLQLLLGRSAAQSPRWMVIAADFPIAFAFGAWEGHVRIPESEILTQSNDQFTSQPATRNFFRHQKTTRFILHLPSIISALEKAAPESETWKDARL